jgi:hypothetical protein
VERVGHGFMGKRRSETEQGEEEREGKGLKVR